VKHRGHFLSAPGKLTLSSPSPSISAFRPRLRAHAVPPASSDSRAAEQESKPAATGLQQPPSKHPLQGAIVCVSETAARPCAGLGFSMNWSEQK